MSMKSLRRKIITLLLSALAISGFTSCQDEEEMEGRIITGVCWEGVLPIKEYYGQENYFSRFFFYEENSYKYGFEEFYYKGVYQQTYEFGWYWLNDAYSVIALNYGGRWQNDISCIDLREVTNNYMYGYFYMDVADYWAYKDGSYDHRSDHYIELKHVNVNRRQD